MTSLATSGLPSLTKFITDITHSLLNCNSYWVNFVFISLSSKSSLKNVEVVWFKTTDSVSRIYTVCWAVLLLLMNRTRPAKAELILDRVRYRRTLTKTHFQRSTTWRKPQVIGNRLRRLNPRTATGWLTDTLRSDSSLCRARQIVR